ncbi:glycosyltransferase family 2 protein [Lactobacillus amylovorus]|uniref:glycosyltransferase family 2 protein n=1 Tax=Lactobacillus amylovorus TaxID=1604 RepID=UPI0022E66CE9|nr:glycosyltransferase family 2 protein [Lactobacillus amylovorus]
MLISVVVPVYNTEKYLKRCLLSLVDQTYKKIQIIVVDDGSTDNSGKICDSFAKNNSHIQVIHKVNGGLSSARNCGLQYCRGDYVTFLDSDDWFSNDYIEKCVCELNKEHVDLLLTPYIREYSRKSIFNPLFSNKYKLFDSKEINDIILARLFGPSENELRFPARVDDLSTAWGKFYLTSKCKLIKFVDTKIIGTEDAWFNINYVYNIESAEYFEKTAYHYNKENDNSLVRKYNPKLFIRWCNLYARMECFISKKNLADSFRKRLDNRIICNLIGLSNNIFNSSLPVYKKYLCEKDILNQKIYNQKFLNFSFENLSFSWRIFFKLCSKKQAAFLTLFIPIGEKLKGKMK